MFFKKNGITILLEPVQNLGESILRSEAVAKANSGPHHINKGMRVVLG
jgi:hypothetical protein